MKRPVADTSAAVDLDASAKALTSLGLSGAEAEIYVRLLIEPDAVTGYKIAQAIGKPVANTYKALESLSNKGAVIIDAGASRLCRPVPPDELLNKFERRFNENKRGAARSLARIKKARRDDRVYQLQTAEQVLERCRAMLRRSQAVVVADIFPALFGLLRPDFEAAAQRGVRAVVKAYEPANARGVDVFVDPEGAEVVRRWPGQWLNLIADGKETLLALLGSPGGPVHQALWSGSAYLACVLHSALLSETVLAGIAGDTPSPSIRRLFKKYCSVDSIRGLGYKALLRRFEGPAEEN